jgi:hypothetical protein
LVINGDSDLDEDVSEWFTRLMQLLLNDAHFVYPAFAEKVKYLSLVKNIVELSLQQDKEPLSSSTLDFLMVLAKEAAA